jgi:hypothetical protein
VGFFVLKELRLDTVRAVVAPLAEEAVRPAHELEQAFVRLCLSRRRWRAVWRLKGFVARRSMRGLSLNEDAPVFFS